MAVSAPIQTVPWANCLALVYKQGEIHEDISLSKIDGALREDGCIVWLDVEGPTERDFELLAEEFGLHPLAIEDVHKAHQRPKLDEYGDSRLIVLFDMLLKPDGLALQELDIFVGPNYLITVHRSPIAAIAEMRERWRRHPGLIEPSPLGFLLYYLTDMVVDNYFPVADALAARIDQIEDRLVAGFDRSVRLDRSVLQEIFGVRRDLLQFRRVLGPERDVFNTLSRRDDPVFDHGTVAYFDDIMDLLLRLTSTVDIQRELLAAAIESYRSLQSNALNEVIKRMTAMTITLMAPTLIAGVYGMNFEHMPELGWALGYPFALTLMVVAVLGTLLFFRREGWL